MYTVRIIIDGRLSGLNEYTRECRRNRYAGAKLKKENEQKVFLGIMRSTLAKSRITKPVYITYKWYEPNKKRDLDNIAFAKKFVQDALVANGILENDGWANIVGFCDEFYVDKENPRVEVEIMEVEK